METLEKHFDAAFFGPLKVKLHRGRYDPPPASGSGAAPDDDQQPPAP